MTRFATVAGGRESIRCSHCGTSSHLYMPPSGLCESCGCQSLVVDEGREALRKSASVMCALGVMGRSVGGMPVGKVTHPDNMPDNAVGNAFRKIGRVDKVNDDGSVWITVNLSAPAAPETIERESRTPERPPTCDMPGCEMDAIYDERQYGVRCEDHVGQHVCLREVGEFQIETVPLDVAPYKAREHQLCWECDSAPEWVGEGGYLCSKCMDELAEEKAAAGHGSWCHDCVGTILCEAHA